MDASDVNKAASVKAKATIPKAKATNPKPSHSHMLPQHWHCQTTHNVYINIHEALNSSTRNLFNNGEQSLNCYSMMGNRS